MTARSPLLSLNNGVQMPALGLGVFQNPPEQTVAAVEIGDRGRLSPHRHGGVVRQRASRSAKGSADRASPATRCSSRRRSGSATTATTPTLHAFEKSARKLSVDRLDLLLLHQPLPAAFDLTLDAYRALEKLLADGKVRAIGVSNFMPEHLRAAARGDVRRAGGEPDRGASVLPADGAAASARRARHRDAGVVAHRRDHVLPWRARSARFDDPTLLEIARQHGKSAAQVMLRWHLQEGRSAIPKSVKPARIAENFDVFDFELSREQIAAIDALETGVRGGPEPDSITLEAYGKAIPEA